MRSSSFLEASAFFRSQHQPEEHKFPYLQLHLFTSHFGNGALTYEKAQKNFNLKEEASVFKHERNFSLSLKKDRCCLANEYTSLLYF